MTFAILVDHESLAVRRVEQLSQWFDSLNWLRQRNNANHRSTLSPSAIMKVRKSFLGDLEFRP
jgi:hypothetical protein